MRTSLIVAAGVAMFVVWLVIPITNRMTNSEWYAGGWGSPPSLTRVNKKTLLYLTLTLFHYY